MGCGCKKPKNQKTPSKNVSRPSAPSNNTHGSKRIIKREIK